jgi:hypothetical protein
MQRIEVLGETDYLERAWPSPAAGFVKFISGFGAIARKRQFH